jgi:hypothetical protein
VVRSVSIWGVSLYPIVHCDSINSVKAD